MTQKITGIIERFVFQNADNGFSVAVINAKSTAITARGYLPSVHVGQEVEITGTWVNHAKFGRQFEIDQCISKIPTSVVGLKKYLGSGAIKGIGPTYAERLVKYFGTNVLDIIADQPHRLAEIPGLGKKRIETIVQTWQDQKEISNIMIFLQERNISIALATRIYKKYKQESLAILNQNPYRLADELWGVSFRIADDLAHKMGFTYDSPERIVSGIIFTITCATQQGHLYIELHNLKEKVVQLLGLDQLPHDQAQILIKQALHKLYDLNKIKLVTHQEQHFLTLTPYYASERGLAYKILKLISYPPTHTFNLEEIYKKIQAVQHATDIALNEQQQSGILACLQHKVTVITGGPGTGKTTLIKKLLNVLDDHKLTYKLAAPTGRAAKRVMESTRKQAYTLHRLLDFNPATGKFNYNENNALSLHFLIIDEASMIDIFLAHAIFKAIPYNAHIVLIGDVDQLPSVGPGNVLHDIIVSSQVTYIQLTHIFRQAQDSLIITNAHRINRGQYPELSQHAQQDFKIICEEDPATLELHLKKMLFIHMRSHAINPRDVMILAPMNKGPAGTHMLNHILQDMLNPAHKKTGISCGSQFFCLQDKVMQIRNNYHKQVYNGDIGIITHINHEDKELIVTFDRTYTISYDFEELHELTLAYAISIHKSQGSEYPAVIIPIFMQHFVLLQRKLIYTALTRAKKQCIFIGQAKAIAMAIKNTKSIQRTTFLQYFLQDFSQDRIQS